MIAALLERHRKTKLRKKVLFYAKKYKLPFELVASIILTESAGNRFAYRYEPGFFEKYLKDKTASQLTGRFPSVISRETELHARATSWGLMQIMGQVAREFGYENDHLHRLTTVDDGLEFGCRKLAKCFRQESSELVAIARYNGNPAQTAAQIYAQKVMRVMTLGQYEKIFK